MNYNSSLKPSSIKSSCRQYKIYLQNENLVYESLKTDVNSIVTDSSSSGEAIKTFKDKVLNYSAIIATLIEANNLDIMEADSFIELVGDEVLDGMTIIREKRSAKGDYDRYRGEASSCYEKAYKATSVEMANHWKSEASHYDGLASSAYQTYDFYCKKEEKYDQINSASALLFQKSPDLRTAANNLMDLLSEGASDEDIKKCRQDLKNAYDRYADYAFKDNAFSTDSTETLWEYSEKEFDKSTEVGKNLSDLYEHKAALEKAMEQDPANRNWYLGQIAILEGNIQSWTEYGLKNAEHSEEFTFVYENCLGNYSEEDRLKIVAYWMSVDKDGDLTGKELPKWWMDEHLTVPRNLQVTEDDVTKIVYEYDNPDGKYAGLCNYYYSSYYLIDCISGMGSQKDALGNPLTAERIRNMSATEYGNIFPMWYDYMYGAMGDYVNGTESIRAAKYIFENKFGWGNNKTQTGVYNTLTNESTGLYECEYYAYLTKFNHIDDFINNGNLFDAKTDREKQLFKYIRDDGNYNSSGIELKPNEKMIIQAAYDNDKNGELPIASYKEADIVIKELEDKLKETIYADYEDNIDVRIEGNKVIITYKGGEGKHGPDEVKAFTYTFELNESVNAFGGKYISQKEYMKCIQDFSQWRFDKGYIEPDMVDYFRYEADQTLRKTFGEDAVNNLINSNPEDYEKIIQAQIRNTYSNDVFIDTFLDVERNVDESMAKLQTAKAILGTAALVASLVCPGTQAAALLLIGDGALGIYEGSVKIYQGDVEGGIIEIGGSTLELVGGAMQEVKLLSEFAAKSGNTNVITDISNSQQKSIINSVENGEGGSKALTNIQKGNYGEMKMDVYFESQGYTRLGPDDARVLDLNSATHHGIDGVYYKPDGNPPYIIGEAKYGSSKLSVLKDGTPQMSDDWIKPRLKDFVGSSTYDTILETGYDRVLFHVDGDGNIVTSLLDNAGKVIK